MSTLKKRIDRLAPTQGRRTFIVTASSDTPEAMIDKAIVEAGHAEPFDLIHVIDEFGSGNAEIKILDCVPGGLKRGYRRGYT